jgi:hypothetical protein
VEIKKQLENRSTGVILCNPGHKMVTIRACRKHMRRFDTTNHWFSWETLTPLCGKPTVVMRSDWRRSFLSTFLKFK